MKGREGRKARAKELWRTPKTPPTMPASISAVKEMVEAKSPDCDVPELALGAIKENSRIIPQKMPSMMPRIEPINETIAIPS